MNHPQFAKLILVSSIALALTACGSSNDDDDTVTPPTTPPPPSATPVPASEGDRLGIASG